MTVEAKVPLKDVKGALSAYNDLYNIITNLEVTFDYKAAVARKTLASLITSIIKIALLVVFIVLAASAEGDIVYLYVILSILMGIFVLLDLIYRQKLPDKKFKKLRIRFLYYIKCFIQDIYEFGCFRKNFGLKTSALGLIFTKKGKSEAYSCLDDYGMMIGEDYLDWINAYNEKYSDYRDYVDLIHYWGNYEHMLEIINSGKATDIQSALAVIDREKHYKKLETIAQEKANRVAEAAERAANAKIDAENRAADAKIDAYDRVARAAEEDKKEDDRLRDDFRRKHNIW